MKCILTEILSLDKNDIAKDNLFSLKWYLQRNSYLQNNGLGQVVIQQKKKYAQVQIF